MSAPTYRKFDFSMEALDVPFPEVEQGMHFPRDVPFPVPDMERGIYRPPEEYALEMGHEVGGPQSELEMWSASDEDNGRSRRGVMAMFTLIAVVAVSVVAVASYSRPGRSAHADAPFASVRTFGDEFNPGSEAEVFASAAPSVVMALNATAPSVPAAPAAAIKVAATANTAANARRSPNKLKPHEDMHDGNICDDSEEMHAGLCYTKCATLTGGTHPFRSTAFSCCATKSCGMNLFKLATASLVPCSGYDVSNATTLHGKACPHVPGTCLTDEEQFEGMCYEKCSALTNGAYPNRVAAATCCKKEGVRCLDPWNEWTAAKFDVGGGLGDHDAETPRRAHHPLESLTEASV